MYSYMENDITYQPLSCLNCSLFPAAPEEMIPKDKFKGNRKKLRGKKKAIQEKQMSTWPVFRPRNPHSEALGLWATLDSPWPEGLEYGTEYHSDREILCESDDEELVAAIDKDEFGNHSMLMVSVDLV